MKKLALCSIMTGFLFFSFAGLTMAQHGHGHSHGAPAAPATPAGRPPAAVKSIPTQSVTVEGLKVTFEVMSMSEHTKHAGMSKGGSHEAHHSQSHMFMVTLQDTASKEIISDAKVTFTAVGSGGVRETGRMAWSGDHYSAGFNPQGKGTYQIQLGIEGGGMEREAKFTYEAK